MKARFKKKGLRSIIVLALICTMMISSACSGFFITLGGKGSKSASSSAKGNNDYVLTHEVNKSDANTADKLNKDLVTEIKTLSDSDVVNYIIQMNTSSIYTTYQAKGSGTYQDYVTGRSVRAAAENMQKKHYSVFNKISSKIEAKFVSSYTGIIDGFALNIKYGDRFMLEEIALGAGAVSINISEQYQAPTYEKVSNSVDVHETGIFSRPVDKDGKEIYDYQGQGMVVAVLDTGLDYDHKAFSVDNLAYDTKGDPVVRLTLSDVEKALPTLSSNANKGSFNYVGTTNLMASELYVNAKVPYAYDYADWDTDVKTGNDGLGGTGHGTHVSGIIVGRSEEPKFAVSDTEFLTPIYYDADNLNNGWKDGVYKYDSRIKRNITGIEGVAPLAQIMAMKVFSDHGTVTDDSAVVSALEDCLRLKPDVINMSLGFTSGFSTQEDNPIVAAAYNAINNEGISLIVAAGNSFSAGRGGHWGVNLASNPDSGTIGSPASYYEAMAVASINGINSKYLLATDGKNGDEVGVAYITESNKTNGEMFDFVADLTAAVKGETRYDGKSYTRSGKDYSAEYMDANGNIDIPFVIIGGTGEQNDYDSAGVSVADKIVFVPRGKTTFSDKLRVAYRNNAIAVVVYNNVGGGISMSLEDDVTLPSCAISMDAFKEIRDNLGSKTPYLHVHKDQGAGPFMSDFSSWGPGYSLEIKPEITGHGGDIYSTFPGDSYDRISGTSMACPNIAGLTILARQHIEKYAKEYGVLKDSSKPVAADNINKNLVEARVYQLMMSTATVPQNEEGDAYSPRRIGAGLANIGALLETDAYIYVEDKIRTYEDKVTTDSKGETVTTRVFSWRPVTTKNAKNFYDQASGKYVKNRTKLELLDDPYRTGVYTMEFFVRNMGKNDITYNLTAEIMTESLASDNLTVAEKAFMLNDSEKRWRTESDNGDIDTSDVVTIPAGSDVKVELIVTLNERAINHLEQTKKQVKGYETDPETGKQILDENNRPIPIYAEWKPFENGMYIEGFVRLIPTEESKSIKGAKEIGAPYLAFYGDWNDAPMLDASIYETDRDDKDASLNDVSKIISDKGKTYAQSRDLQVYGKYTENNVDYLMPLAKFIFAEAEFSSGVKPYDGQVAYATDDRTVLSMSNNGVKELYYVSGFLRGAKTVTYEIRNKFTGQLLYSGENKNNRRDVPFGNIGGIKLELTPQMFQGQNGGVYTFSFNANLDYDPFLGTQSTSWAFDFTIDTDAPIVTDAQIRVEKNVFGEYRRYLDFYMHDDNYLQGMSFDIYNADTQQWESIWKEGLRPINTAKNSTSRITFELTGYWDFLKANGYTIRTTIYDYALNSSYYEIDLSKVLYTGADKLDFADIGQYKEYTKSGSAAKINLLIDAFDTITYDAEGKYKSMTAINVVPNQSINLSNAVVSTDYTWREDFVWKSSDSSVVQVDSETGEMIARGPGVADITVSSARNPESKATLTVRVMNENDVKSYNMPVLKEDPLKTAKFVGFEKELRAGETYELTIEPVPWFKDKADLEVRWSSTSPTQVRLLDAEEGSDPFTRTVYAVPGTYKGELLPGGDPENPKDIATEYKSNNRTAVEINVDIRQKTSNTWYTATIYIYTLQEFVVEAGTLKQYNGFKSEVIIPDNLRIESIGEACFEGNNNITSVVIPEGVRRIERMAFAYCTNLEEVYLPSTLIMIDEWGFAGKSTIEDGLVTSLNIVDTTKIENAGGTLIVGANAFVNQMALGTNGRIVRGNLDGTNDGQNFRLLEKEEFKFSTKSMVVIGRMAFAYCSYLTEIDVRACRSMNELAFISAGIGAATDFEFYTEIKLGERTALGIASFALTGAKDLVIPMQRIRQEAFSMMEFLETVEFTAENVVIEDLAFYIDASTTKSRLKSVEFKHNVKHIGQAAFYSNSELDTLIFNGRVEYIEEFAFAYNQSLTTFVIKEGLTHIGTGAFVESGITNVVIAKDFDESLKILDAFHNCDVTSLSVESGNLKYYVDPATGVLIKDIGSNNYEMVLTPFTLDVSTTNGVFTVPTDINITSIGSGAFASNTTIKKIVLSNNITSVGEYAFSNMTALEEIVLSTNLKNIPDYCFYGSAKLKTVSNTLGIISIGKYAFAGDLSEISSPSTGEVFSKITFMQLESIELSDNLQSIGEYAFTRTKIKEFIIPLNVTEIKEGTFQYCTSLSIVYFHDLVTRIGDYAFMDTALTSLSTASTDGIRFVGTQAFANGVGQRIVESNNVADAYRTTSKLQRVTLSNAIYIGDGAFAGYNEGVLRSLTLSSSSAEVDLGDYLPYLRGVTLSGVYIGNSAFMMQTSLNSINPSANVTYVGDYAFAFTALPSIGFVKNSLYIGYGAFSDCENLKGTVTIGANAQYVAPLAFANTKITAFAVALGNESYFAEDGVLFLRHENGNELTHFPTGITTKNVQGELINKYVVPEGTIRIGQNAFSTVTSLNSVTLPSTLTVIGDKAFFGSTVSVYIFNSYEAPVLEASADSFTYEGNQFDYNWAVYANFYYYFSPTSNLTTATITGTNISYEVFANIFRYNTITSTNFQDSWLYGTYFDTNSYTEYTLSDFNSGANVSVTGEGDFSKINRYGLEMIRPANGIGYTDFVYDYYFDYKTNGIDALEPATAELIALIATIPASSAVTLNNAQLITDARNAFNRLRIPQQALVSNLTRLTAAEDKINTLTSAIKLYNVVFMSKNVPQPTFKIQSGGKVAAFEDPVRAGATFLGWYYNGEKFNFDTPVTRDMTIISKWTDDVYTVSFTGNSVSIMPQNVEIGSTAQKPKNPTRKGYSFDGWYNGETKFDFSTAIEDDIVLNAKWVKSEEKGCGTVAPVNGPFDAGMFIAILSILSLLSLSIALVTKKRRSNNQ